MFTCEVTAVLVENGLTTAQREAEFENKACQS